jgi:hypothetical protein
LVLRALGSWREVDRVVEIPALLGALRRGLALENPHQTHLTDAAADDVQRLHQTRQAITLHPERRADCLRFRTATEVDG